MVTLVKRNLVWLLISDKVDFFFFFFKDFIYLFLERGEGREKKRERNSNVWLPLMCPLLGTWPTTQARALTGNRTGNPLVLRPALNPLSHPSHGSDKIDFRAKGIIKNKEGCFIMTKGSSHQEEITFLNVYACNKRVSKYMEQNLIELQQKIDKFIILFRG